MLYYIKENREKFIRDKNFQFPAALRRKSKIDEEFHRVIWLFSDKSEDVLPWGRIIQILLKKRGGFYAESIMDTNNCFLNSGSITFCRYDSIIKRRAAGSCRFGYGSLSRGNTLCSFAGSV